ncbi:CBS domain-containing protein [Metabacillus arenae]|uniref:CBS domain-containing protein n=1 Tax=Metabacillus arenae TaxID=2771434 RepID=A0A926NBP8_9BACI|nr:CBS domain-containing protein [Metabacillus arenae]MBD1381307.1 CBS domain-containing protein [Metabacillus arenae]
MKIKEMMTDDIVYCEPNASVKEAALLMKENEIGSVPVCEDDKKVKGIISDRDIVIRCVAEEKTDASVKDVMSEDLITGQPNMSDKEASKLMADHQIRRLPIVEDGALVGMVALGDLAVEQSDKKAGEALSEISK